MTKHTPGPWRADACGNIHSQHADGSDGGYISTTNLDGTRDGGRKEAEANARLIAAAPDLLAACQLVVAWWERRGPLARTGAEGEILKHVSAAISKAEGE